MNIELETEIEGTKGEQYYVCEMEEQEALKHIVKCWGKGLGVNTYPLAEGKAKEAVK